MGQPISQKLLDGVSTTTAGTGDATRLYGSKSVFQCLGRTTTGAGGATVIIEATTQTDADADCTFETLGTITLALSGSVDVSDAFVVDAPWYKARARMSAVSGTGTTVDAIVSYRPD